MASPNSNAGSSSGSTPSARSDSRSNKARLVPRTKLALKKLVVRTICHRRVGQVISRRYRNQIPSRGFVFETGATAVPAYVVPRLFWGLYERAEIDLVSELMDPRLDVIELGSCIGVVSTHVASRLDVDSKLVCVEANPGLIETIENNLKRNAPRPNVTVLNGALAPEGQESVHFSVAPDAVSSRLGSGVNSIEVPAVSLKGLAERFDIGDFTLISDIEGAEQTIIDSDVESLQRCQMFIVEMHPALYPDGTATLERLEKRLADVHGLSVVRRRGDVYCFAR